MGRRGTGTCFARWGRVLAPAVGTALAGVLSTAAIGASGSHTSPAHDRIWPMPRPLAGHVADYALETSPVAVRIGGVGYRMTVHVTAVPQQGAIDDAISVILVRHHQGDLQTHTYEWAPSSPVPVRINPRTLATTIRSGDLIAPSAMSMSFRPITVRTHTCVLPNGTLGSVRIASGSLTESAFRVVTGTSPFFRTIRAVPVRGTVVADPGCARHQPAPDCPGTESITSDNPVAPEQWMIGTNRTGSQVTIEGVRTQPNLAALLQFTHLVEDVVPTSDFTVRTHAEHGATAALLVVARGTFERGTAYFRSTNPPSLVTGVCTFGGIDRHYSIELYRGILSPGRSPLTTLFDTGRMVLRTVSATLAVARGAS